MFCSMDIHYFYGRAGRCDIIGTSVNGNYGSKLFISIQCLITSLVTVTRSTGKKLVVISWSQKLF